MNENIPDPSVRRLSAYLRQLEVLAARGVEHVSSETLAGCMNFGAATVRRDLALFGQFGRRGVGYETTELIAALRAILGTQRQWPVVVVGAGELSHALLRYDGFRMRGFNLVAAFDVDPDKIGRQLGEVTVQSVDELEAVIERTEARVAILAVPAEAAQALADRLVAAGIEGIVNFATPALETPPDVHVSHADITAHLEQLTFHLSEARP
jgi:redox-sensing transcriptional repressor